MKFKCPKCNNVFVRDMRFSPEKRNYKKGKGYRGICSVTGEFTWAKEAK